MAHFTVTRFYDFTNLHKTVGKRFCDGGGAMMRGLVRGAGLVCGAGLVSWCGVGVVVRGWCRGAGLVS
ncbi:hypothetical protein MNL13_06595 [Bartonella krasnovii]|uniref:Uncharacterized protein n=2 Tax=Bartonella krasnovii TaxID=2267275 RepID=A0ABY3VXZ8_9HYPH|nr:hypothetical protein [Bartonella krasnovii]UNF28869.1 hypothetical protein MNL13_06595 [Bartonella krasnovii]